MEFTYEGGKEMGKAGTVTLSVDGRRVGSGKIEKTTPFKYSLDETQDIGRDNGTPVIYTYEPPFVFQGSIRNVIVELK
jgi:arylsulfatase